MQAFLSDAGLAQHTPLQFCSTTISAGFHFDFRMQAFLSDAGLTQDQLLANPSLMKQVR